MDEVIDTRDLIKRREELAEEIETLAQDLAVNDAQQWDNLPEPAQQRYRERAQEEEPELGEEMDEIDYIESEVPDYPYGASLIREDYFTEYAQQLAEDIGAIPDDRQWPAYFIDWGAAANALKMDYTALEYRGRTYYARA